MFPTYVNYECPSEKEAPIAYKRNKCGRFISPLIIDTVVEIDPELRWGGYTEYYNCKKCGKISDHCITKIYW